MSFSQVPRGCNGNGRPGVRQDGLSPQLVRSKCTLLTIVLSQSVCRKERQGGPHLGRRDAPKDQWSKTGQRFVPARYTT